MSCSSINTEAVAKSVPYGTRFCPTDEELVSHYLKEKNLLGNDSLFPEIDCCNHEPWDLIALLDPTEDMVRYFFSPRINKYPNSKRSKRATVQGYWKSTGKPRKIKAGLLNGIKRILTFYKGRAPNSSKTNYIMHEFELENGDFVLCRLKINPDKSLKKKGSSISHEADPDMITEEEEILTFKELQDDLFSNGNVDEHVFSDFDKQEAFDLLQSLLSSTQPQEQHDYCSSTQHSAKEAHLGNAPLADVNNGEGSCGQSELGENNSCLTNKNNISTNDNHEPVSNTASNREDVTQPGKNLEPLFDPLLLDSSPPLPTEPRDFLPGNESQYQFGDSDFSLTIDDLEYLSYLQTTQSPSIDSNLPKSLGTQSVFNPSFQANF